ncbi:hypothetical protein GCM10027612_42810 [Microbispora bryophytorum subsp. camponoti]
MAARAVYRVVKAPRFGADLRGEFGQHLKKVLASSVLGLHRGHGQDRTGPDRLVGLERCQRLVCLGLTAQPDLPAAHRGSGRGRDGDRTDLVGTDPVRITGVDQAGLDRPEDQGEDPLLSCYLGLGHLPHHQQGGLLHADQAAAGNRRERGSPDDQRVGAAGVQPGQEGPQDGHVRGRESDEGVLPVALVDLPELLAGPPPTDRGHHVVDAAEPALHLVSKLLGAGERRVVVDRQVQAVGRRVTEHAPELLRPLLGAGRDDDIGTGGEVAADYTLSYGARAARNDDPATGQIGKCIAAVHKIAPRGRCGATDRRSAADPTHVLAKPTLCSPT